MNILVDTNIWLDIALQRLGLVEGSEQSLLKCEREGHVLWVSWHTLSNIYYILRRDRGPAPTLQFIQALLSTSLVSSVGHDDALRAIAYGLADFEDALQLSAAEAMPSCRATKLISATRRFRSSRRKNLSARRTRRYRPHDPRSTARYRGDSCATQRLSTRRYHDSSDAAGVSGMLFPIAVF